MVRRAIARAARIAFCIWIASAVPGQAQDIAGIWDGIARGTRVEVRFDSSGAGFTGRLYARSFSEDTLPLDSVRFAQGVVSLQLTLQSATATFEGVLSREGRRLDGAILSNGDTLGLFRFARRGTEDARRLLAQLERTRPGKRITRPDPDSARLVTEDIPRFWAVLDSATADSLEDRLLREYLIPGTPGLRDFMQARIMSAADLARMVQRRRARYDSVRAATLRVTEASDRIRADYRKLKALYPDAVYPDVYFVIGRLNTGGTATDNGLLIGAEMYRDPAQLPVIVAHELVHFQQQPLVVPPSLLTQSFREGAADFVAELIAGEHINQRAHRYGMPHERELWTEFRTRMHGTSTSGWLYGDPPGERPPDLGYFIGHRIAKAFYERAEDKGAALREIIRGENPVEILERSGYDP